MKDIAKKAIVRTTVHIGTPSGLEGYGLAVDIKVEGVDKNLINAGHEVCLDSLWIVTFTKTLPKSCIYSRALAHGAEVKVSLA